MKVLTKELVENFRCHLINEEKSRATTDKYVRDVTALYRWAENRELTRSLVLQYKQTLTEKYAPTSVNSILSSLNSFFGFAGWSDFRIKTLKIQQQIFSDKEKELSKAEYEKLLKEASCRNNERLYLVLQTICSTGIRVSELKFITVQAVKEGHALISCKGRMRVVILPKQLCKMLSKYIKSKEITNGSVFVTKGGKPLDRTNIWADMKKLCKASGVPKDKVFPHNLRHLFARTYYSVQMDIVRLADILGHSSVNTTRIYTMEAV